MDFAPDNHAPGIVHIGPGAFHRAHQAVYTQDAMMAKGGDWRITAISPRSTAVADALRAQGGCYTLVTRGAEGTEYRKINAISDALALRHNPNAALAALTRPTTRIVSLTVTEKAYQKDAEVITLLVRALDARRTAGGEPFAALSCDNLADNGTVLRQVIQEAAQAKDPALADWLAEHGRFPATMVDRITPAATAALRAEVAAQTGWNDGIPVETEAFSQWVIEDDFPMGRPAWEAAGAILIRDVAPYERMKLRMLNGAHSMLAYAGHVAGLPYVRDVMMEPVLAAQVARHMDAAGASLPVSDALDPVPYRDALLTRFRNPHLAHETYQIAMDGSQKMPQRIFAAALDASRKGQDIGDFCWAVACWLRYLTGRTDAGEAYDLRDPRQDVLASLPMAAADRVDALCALDALVPEALAADHNFRVGTAKAFEAIQTQGVVGALAERHREDACHLIPRFGRAAPQD